MLLEEKISEILYKMKYVGFNIKSTEKKLFMKSETYGGNMGAILWLRNKAHTMAPYNSELVRSRNIAMYIY